jgi:hypothetical protein
VGYISLSLCVCVCVCNNYVPAVTGMGEREMCPWAISKYFGDLVSNTSV